MSPALLWMIAGLAMLIIEVVVGTFFLMWVGAGALITAVAALLFPGMVWLQWLIFAVVSSVLLAVSRPFARSLHARVTVPSNVDGLIGQQAVVLQTIDGHANTGRIRIRSEEWRARSDSVIPDDEKVVITGIEGTTLLVKPVEQ